MTVNSKTKKESSLAILPEKEWSENRITPEYQINETEDTFIITVSVPGVKKENLEMVVEGDKLVVTGRKGWKIPSDAAMLYQEIPLGDYHLPFKLDHRVNRDAVKAELNQGVLTLTVPKAEEVKPRRIEIGG